MNTKFKLKLIGLIALAAVFGFSLIGCGDPEGGAGGGPGTRADIIYTVEQVGGANKTADDDGADSTGIKFTFNAPIDDLGLTAADITVGGAAAKATNATFDGSGKIWILENITVSAAGLATVSINKTGIEAAQKSTIVYKEGQTAPEYWTVTWELRGGDKGAGAYPELIEKGAALAQPSPNPARTSYTFDGWYSDSGLTQAYDFSGAVTANLTLYAKWTAVQGSAPPITYYIYQVGGIDGSKDSFAIGFMFDKSVDSLGLTIDDFIVGGKAAIDTGAARVLQGTGGFRQIAITVNGAGTATVQINKSGIEAAQKAVTVFRNGEMAPITYTAEQSGGMPGTNDSTGIIFGFSRPVNGLTVNDITITDGTGSVTIGGRGLEEISGGENTYWTLHITVVRPGDVTVSVSKAGLDIDSVELSVAVYKALITYTAEQIGGTAGTTSSTSIRFSFSKSIDDLGLTADDITVTDGTGSALKAGSLTSNYGTYLPIHVVRAGNVTVKITKDGFNNEAQSVEVFKGPSSLSNGSAIRTSETTATIGFAAGVAGEGYYLAVEQNAQEPTNAEVKEGASLGEIAIGMNSGIAVDLPSGQGAKNVYVGVADATGNINDLLVINVEAFNYTKDNPIPLTAGVWENGRIDSNEHGYDAHAVWYSFDVTAGTTYYVWLNNDAGDGTKTSSVDVSAYYSDGMSPIFQDQWQGWTTPQSFTASSAGMVKIRVKLYYPAFGSFAITYSTDVNGKPENTSPGAPGYEIPLVENIWASGEGRNLLYYFNVVSGQTYYVWAGRSARVSAYYDNDDTAIFTNQSAWDTSQSFTASLTGIVKVRASEQDNYGGKDVAYTTLNARPGTASDPARTLVSVTANGSAEGQLTTQLTLTFDQVIGLSANDIFLSGVPVTKGTLSNLGAVYTLVINNVTQSGNLSVTVARSGLNISNATQYVDIYHYPITLTSVTANGGATTAATTALTLTFSQAIPGLTADDIALTTSVAGVTKGTLSNNGAVYTLPISGFTAGGTLSVAVTKAGFPINGSPRSVSIYVAPGTVNNPIPLTEGVWVNGWASYSDTVYHTFQVTANTTYYVWWNDYYAGNGSKSGNINVSASYAANGTSIFADEDKGWNPAKSFTAASTGTVRLTAFGVANGSYAIAYTTENTSPSSTPRTFVSVTANGSATTTTTALTLTFDQAITNLNVNDITLSGIDGVVKGTLSNSGAAVYTLGISGLTSGGTLSVSVAKALYIISGSPQEVAVNYHSYSPTFSSVTADGSASQTTTQLTLTFSGPITGLNANNITLSGVSGVTKGTLIGTGPVYYLPISNVTQNGTLNVAVSNPTNYTISGTPKTVQIYYLPPTPVTFNSVTPVSNATGSTTAALTLTFSQAIAGLTANDITLSGAASTGIVKGVLTGAGPSYTLPISGFTAGGSLSVAVAKAGYVVSGTPQTVTITAPVSIAAIAGVGTPESSGRAITAITETDQYRGSISWSPSPVAGRFVANTVYTATIFMTAKSGFTFNGLANDFFTVAGATAVNSSNNAGSTIRVTAAFLATGAALPFEYRISPYNNSDYRLYRGNQELTSSNTLSSLLSIIRGDAAGNDCTIQFSSLDNRNKGYLPEFTNDNNWGTVTITGSLTASSVTDVNTIVVGDGVSVIVAGNISHTATNGNAIRLNGTGTLTINSGTISATGGSGSAIYQNGTGTITVNGGTISATTGSAIYSANTGTITVTGASTSVTSANTTATSGTIYVADSGTGTGIRINVSGGEVKNTASGNAIYNASTGAVIVSGSGKATATTGSAIYNNSSGMVSVSGNAQVTSANVAATSGTIHLAGTATGDRLAISANGSVSNTASGNAIYNNSSGDLRILGGGTVSTETSAYAILNDNAASMITLGGSPTITGVIRPSAPGKLTVIRTAGDTQFTPSGKMYILDYAALATNEIAVAGGGTSPSLLSSFTCRVGGTQITLRGSGANLVR